LALLDELLEVAIELRSERTRVSRCLLQFFEGDGHVSLTYGLA
jgi:hypothetical protein